MKFHSSETVIRRTHPKTWHERLKKFWNKELELPVLPLGAAFTLLFIFAVTTLPGGNRNPVNPEPFKEGLIEAGGNIYWKKDYERAVEQHEDQN
ncbi:hypothetical protein EBB07_13305 [Paenibacillaceae bacterium]|nr:hypothetical protein EBB07_13305 [Paenibacillaceae bacterium]